MAAAKKTYWEKLRDPRWQKKRLEVMEANDFSCEICGDNENTLNVHHKEYFKGQEPWDYKVEQLACLCENCHEAEHGEVDILKLVCSYASLCGPCDRKELACLLAGYMDITYDSLLTKLNSENNLWISIPYKIGQKARKLSQAEWRKTHGKV